MRWTVRLLWVLGVSLLTLSALFFAVDRHEMATIPVEQYKDPAVGHELIVPFLVLGVGLTLLAVLLGRKWQ